MKKSGRLLSLLCTLTALLFNSCSDDALSVNNYSAGAPSAKPLINVSDYKSGMHDSISYKTGFANGNLRTKKIILKWAKITDGDFICYKIYRDNVLVEVINNRDNAVYEDTLYTVPAMPPTPGALYKYKIAVINASGISQHDTISLRTAKTGTPSNTYFYVNSLGTGIELYWHNNAQYAGSYDIWRKKLADHDSLFRKVGTTADTTLTDNSTAANPIVLNQAYRYKIVVRSQWEKLDSLQFTAQASTAPANPTAVSADQKIRSQAVILKWSNPFNGSIGDKIEIKRKTTGQSSFRYLATLTDRKIKSYLDSNTKPDTTYSYQIRYLRTIGIADSSDFISSNSVTVQKMVPDSVRGFDSDNTIPSEFITSSDASGWKLHNNTPAAPTYYGEKCIKSGTVPAGGKSVIKKVLTVKAGHSPVFNLRYKISSRDDYDGFAIYVNGNIMGKVTGWNDWSGVDIAPLLMNNTSSDKIFTVELVYFRGATTSTDDNCVYIDNIEIKNN